MEKQGYVYILASKRNGTLYIGVTSNLVERIQKHRKHMIAGFTSKYRVTQLVYFEVYGRMVDALNREKQLKRWHRKWKINLIEKVNPAWRDLYSEVTGFDEVEDSYTGS